MEDSDSDDDGAPQVDVKTLKWQLLNMLRPGETVTAALKRLSKPAGERRPSIACATPTQLI